MDEKRAMEDSAARELVAAINRATGRQFAVTGHTDRPDIVITDGLTGQTIGVEVTHLFYDEEEARILLQRPDYGDPYYKVEDIRTYIGRLNELIEQKVGKADEYQYSDELGLLIKVASPVFVPADFAAHDHLIHIPINGYNYIWLLFYDSEREDWGIIERLQ